MGNTFSCEENYVANKTTVEIFCDNSLNASKKENEEFSNTSKPQIFTNCIYQSCLESDIINDHCLGKYLVTCFELAPPKEYIKLENCISKRCNNDKCTCLFSRNYRTVEEISRNRNNIYTTVNESFVKNPYVLQCVCDPKISTTTFIGNRMIPDTEIVNFSCPRITKTICTNCNDNDNRYVRAFHELMNKIPVFEYENITFNDQLSENKKLTNHSTIELMKDPVNSTSISSAFTDLSTLSKNTSTTTHITDTTDTYPITKNMDLYENRIYQMKENETAVIPSNITLAMYMQNFEEHAFVLSNNPNTPMLKSLFCCGWTKSASFISIVTLLSIIITVLAYVQHLAFRKKRRIKKFKRKEEENYLAELLLTQFHNDPYCVEDNDECNMDEESYDENEEDAEDYKKDTYDEENEYVKEKERDKPNEKDKEDNNREVQEDQNDEEGEEEEEDQDDEEEEGEEDNEEEEDDEEEEEEEEDDEEEEEEEEEEDDEEEKEEEEDGYESEIDK